MRIDAIKTRLAMLNSGLKNQRDLAAKAGICANTVSNLMRGATAKIETIGLLALSERDREVLMESYVDRERRFDGHTERLAAKYNVSTNYIHRLQEKAITTYCACMVVVNHVGARCPLCGTALPSHEGGHGKP